MPGTCLPGWDLYDLHDLRYILAECDLYDLRDLGHISLMGSVGSTVEVTHTFPRGWDWYHHVLGLGLCPAPVRTR